MGFLAWGSVNLVVIISRLQGLGFRGSGQFMPWAAGLVETSQALLK